MEGVHCSTDRHYLLVWLKSKNLLVHPFSHLGRTAFRMDSLRRKPLGCGSCLRWWGCNAQAARSMISKAEEGLILYKANIIVQYMGVSGCLGRRANFRFLIPPECTFHFSTKFPYRIILILFKQMLHASRIKVEGKAEAGDLLRHKLGPVLGWPGSTQIRWLRLEAKAMSTF